MGIYVNPKTENKEAFLSRSSPITLEQALAFDGYKTSTMLPVVLVVNPTFTAAAVAFSAEELRAFTNPTDLRTKLFFLVFKSLLNDDVGIDPKLLEKMINPGS